MLSGNRKLVRESVFDIVGGQHFVINSIGKQYSKFPASRKSKTESCSLTSARSYG